MLLRPIVPALIAASLAPAAALAQAPDSGDIAKTMTQKIHEKLTSEGFKDVRVVPQSFLISAKDKDGNEVMMLLGPDTMTVLKAPGTSDPSTAESPDKDDKIIQQ